MNFKSIQNFHLNFDIGSQNNDVLPKGWHDISLKTCNVRRLPNYNLLQKIGRSTRGGTHRKILEEAAKLYEFETAIVKFESFKYDKKYNFENWAAAEEFENVSFSEKNIENVQLNVKELPELFNSFVEEKELAKYTEQLNSIHLNFNSLSSSDVVYRIVELVDELKNSVKSIFRKFQKSFNRFISKILLSLFKLNSRSRHRNIIQFLFKNMDDEKSFRINAPHNNVFILKFLNRQQWIAKMNL